MKQLICSLNRAAKCFIERFKVSYIIWVLTKIQQKNVLRETDVINGFLTEENSEKLKSAAVSHNKSSQGLFLWCI